MHRLQVFSLKKHLVAELGCIEQEKFRAGKDERNLEQFVASAVATLSKPGLDQFLIDKAANEIYAGWPERLYVVGVDGKVAYKGGPGPGGFKIAEVEEWLKKNLK